MPITLNGSGTITGVTTLGTALTSPTLTTPIVTTTMGVGNATPSASGSGVTFPATQSASSDANTLDDYEEGTFTPTYGGGTTFGTTTYTFRYGYYTKIGRLVNFVICMGWSNATGTGESRVSGLPFTSANLTECYSPVAIRNDGIAQSSGQIQGYVAINDTAISIGYASLTTGVNADIPVDTSVTRLMLQGSYYTT